MRWAELKVKQLKEVKEQYESLYNHELAFMEKEPYHIHLCREISRFEQMIKREDWDSYNREWKNEQHRLMIERKYPIPNC